MRLALLTAHIGNPWPNLGDYFITRSIAALLHEHELAYFPLHERPRAEDMARLAAQDRIIICGTNLIGVGGTVRSAYRVGHFERLKVPVVPLALGGQADLDGAVPVDASGRALLAYWKASTGPISVRDELSRDCLDRLLGRGSAALTGCSTMFVPPRAEPRGDPAPVTLVCTGPFLHSLRPRRQGTYVRIVRDLLERVEREGPARVLHQQADGLHFGGRLPATFCPQEPEENLRAVQGAGRVLSFRIHPLVVAVSSGVPGVLIALDERTRSLARTMGIPHESIRWDSPHEAERLFRRFNDVMSAYPWHTIRERIATLQGSFLSHLERQGLVAHGAAAGVARPVMPPIASMARKIGPAKLVSVAVWKRLSTQLRALTPK